MSGATVELNLATAVDADDNADYLTISLANSLRTVDGLFNNVTGHTHGGAHQGGPVGTIPISAIPDGSITSAKIADGTITSADIADGTITGADLAPGVAAGNVGALGGALNGFLPNPQIASGAVIVSPAISNPVITGNPTGAPCFGAWTAWTPSISQGGAAIGVTVNYARYLVVGKHVTVAVYLTVSSSNATGASPIIVTSIPLPPTVIGGYMTVGAFSYLRSGNTAIAGVCVLPVNPQIQFNAFSSAGGAMMGASPNFAVGVNDQLSFTINYETS